MTPNSRRIRLRGALAALLLVASAATVHAYVTGGSQSGGCGSGGDEKFTALLGVPGGAVLPARFDWRLVSRNPMGRTAILELALPRAASVTIRMFDIAGREVARPIAGRAYGAGTQRVEISVGRLPAGYYLTQLLAESPQGGTLFRSVKKLVRLN